MNECKFINTLNKLRKSSSDSIDNIQHFDSFREYMHVKRSVEVDLKSILREVNSKNIKTLVLLCGSAGDGKSHLLSYLKNSDPDSLLKNYKVFNDATESNSPNKTAVETLYNRLSDYNDENINMPGSNAIIAINLGVLNNFIESDYASEFSILKQYVKKSNILSIDVDKSLYDDNSHFQHISFSDYHMFSLNKDGINAEYIEALFERVTLDDERNVFNISYKTDCKSCPLYSMCPIRTNYEFISNPIVRHNIANMLVKVIIKDKEIITTRELLNYIYDIIAPSNFDYPQFYKSSINPANFLKAYLNNITPSVLFDNIDVSTIMNKTRKYDPLLLRNENEDDIAIGYYVSDDITNTVTNYLNGSPYNILLSEMKYINIINEDKSIKSRLFNVVIRVRDLINNYDNDKTFSSYSYQLYNYNTGDVSKLADLYSDIEEAINCWCGNEADGNICIGASENGFSIYENINFDPYLDNMPQKTIQNSIQKFIPYIVAEYQSNSTPPIHLDIDYSLYELIEKLKNGYVQTAEDRNDHADFISFISKMLKTGSSDRSITVVSSNGQKAILEKTKFGTYKFKVVG